MIGNGLLEVSRHVFCQVVVPTRPHTRFGVTLITSLYEELGRMLDVAIGSYSAIQSFSKLNIARPGLCGVWSGSSADSLLPSRADSSLGS